MQETTNVTLIYPFDPLGPKVGGIETFIKGFIKYAPEHFKIKHVGITSSQTERPVGTWQSLEMGRKKFEFFPVLYERDENKKSLVPLSIRFIHYLKGAGLDFSQQILIFNRLEPAFLFLNYEQRKIGFIHNDIEQTMRKGSDSFWKYAPWLYFHFENRIFSDLDHLYVVNNKALRFYKNKYSSYADKMDFLPTWVDQDIFHVPTQSKMLLRTRILKGHTIQEGHKWVLFVGRLQEQKAPLRLLESFYEYLRHHPASCLLIIGEGNLKQEMIKRVSELDIAASVHFLGFKTQAEIARFYQASDVLLLTSNYEGMPRCCLEALGSGLPVVSTNAGEIQLVVRNGFSGEVVDDFKPEVIAEGIRRVIGRPLNYSEQNCLKSIEKYTPRRVLKRVFSLLDSYSVSASVIGL
jgi:glycosyltransferase involved in cell wall biosynthesis